MSTETDLRVPHSISRATNTAQIIQRTIALKLCENKSVVVEKIGLNLFDKRHFIDDDGILEKYILSYENDRGIAMVSTSYKKTRR